MPGIRKKSAVVSIEVALDYLAVGIDPEKEINNFGPITNSSIK